MDEDPPGAARPQRRLLEQLCAAPPAALGLSVRAIEHEPARPGRSGDFPLPAELAGILRRRGIRSLFRHQADALRAWSEGQDVLISTGTASGKSLIYTLATALTALDDPSARTLGVFPLKALEHDQLAGLRADLAATPLASAGSLRAEIYDGDTSPDLRKVKKINMYGVFGRDTH